MRATWTGWRTELCIVRMSPVWSGKTRGTKCVELLHRAVRLRCNEKVDSGQCLDKRLGENQGPAAIQGSMLL